VWRLLHSGFVLLIPLLAYGSRGYVRLGGARPGINMSVSSFGVVSGLAYLWYSSSGPHLNLAL